jgi:hypothetical protein
LTLNKRILPAVTVAMLMLLAIAASAPAAPTDAPQMSLRGQTISWPLIDGTITRYVFVRKVPGSPDQYSNITCATNPCEYTPAPASGLTVKHSVRTDVNGSNWASPELAITYQTSTAAPVLSVSGTTIRWNRVADVDSYVFVTKVPGQADAYSIITCSTTPCEITPPAVPGARVNYGMRTNVTDSTWATEVSITYGGAAPSALEIGMNGTPDWLSMLRAGIDAIDARVVRLDLARMRTTTAKDDAVNTAHAGGARPEFVYTDRSTSPAAIRADALRYGPTATSTLPLLYVEFGNEDSYSYKGATAATARTYGDQVEAVANALVGTGVKVIVQADDAKFNATTNWVANMYSTFPDMDEHPGVGGWVIHPYGPDYLTRINRLITQTTAQGAPASFPIFVTEFGLSTDNGPCLSDNYGWNPCMTYAQAGTTMRDVVNDVRANAPAVKGWYIYNEIDSTTPGASTDREMYFGVMRRDGTSKPGFTDMVAYLANGGS